MQDLGRVQGVMKFLLVDDHWSARAAIKLSLGDSGRDVEFIEVENFEAAVSAAEENKDLDLIVCDLIIPGLMVLDDLKRLLLSGTRAPVVIFSMVEDRYDAARAMELGAAGYIPKTLPGETIKEALAQVLKGEAYLPPNELKALPRRAFDAEGYGTFDAVPLRAINSLTGRQREVLSCLARGAPNEVIARELGLSHNTVRIHISAILRTLELKNRTQAALMAARFFAQ